MADHRDGELPPLLVLHGWQRDRRDVAGLAEASRRCSVTPDLPGFGSSDAPVEAWGAREYADAVAEFIRACDVSGPFVVVGHSFGGRVAVCLAAYHPRLVAGLVLMGTPLVRLSASGSRRRRGVNPLYRVIRGLRRLRLVPERTLEAARQRYGSADYRSASGVMRDVLVRVVNEDYRRELEQIDHPVALIWGQDDDVCPFRVAEEAASHLKRVVAVEAVPGAGHDVHRYSPNTVMSAIQQVVAEL